MENNQMKVKRSDCIQSVTEKSNREIIQEIIKQIKKSGVALSERQSIELFKLLSVTNCTKHIVEIVFEAVENTIKDYLYEANNKIMVVVNIFKGISIKAKYIPERIKINNFKGKKQKYTSYIKPKAEFSRGFVDSITKH